MTAPTGWANDDAVIDAASRLAASLGSDPNHTVAAAAMDLHGNIFAGVNNHHFTGGPCAELVVLGMTASAQAAPLATIVAVGDGGRGVIPPCGRCRQVLLDQHPDCHVLVPTETGIRSVPIAQLLPYSYRQPDENPRRFIRFNTRYYESIRAGEKTHTIRYRDPAPLGPITLAFEDGENVGFTLLPGVIDGSTRIRLSDLDQEYQEGLRGHYPDLPDDAELDDIRFHLA